MTEPDELPQSEIVPEAPEQPAPPSGRRFRRWPVILLLGLILAAGAAYVWQSKLRQTTETLASRITHFAQPRAEPSADLARVTSRLDALTARIDTLEHDAATSSQRMARLDELSARVAAVSGHDQNIPPDLNRRLDAADARLGALEQNTAAMGANVEKELRNIPPNLNQRLDAADARLGALEQNTAATGANVEKELRNIPPNLNQRLDAADARFGVLEQNVARTGASAAGAIRLARIVAAEAALSAGRPLGELPGAPAAVSRFATTAAPTEPALRLRFPEAARAALAASPPGSTDKPLMQRMLARAEELVTVRQGDQVLLGNPAAGILARAQDALNAGDLSDAVAALSGLSGRAASAMAPWLADAKALLDARAGLADLAAHS